MLFDFISLIFSDLASQLQIQGNQELVLLFDDLFVASHLVEFFEISQFIGQSLGKKFVIVFS